MLLDSLWRCSFTALSFLSYSQDSEIGRAKGITLLRSCSTTPRRFPNWVPELGALFPFDELIANKHLNWAGRREGGKMRFAFTLWGSGVRIFTMYSVRRTCIADRRRGRRSQEKSRPVSYSYCAASPSRPHYICMPVQRGVKVEGSREGRSIGLTTINRTVVSPHWIENKTLFKQCGLNGLPWSWTITLSNQRFVDVEP